MSAPTAILCSMVEHEGQRFSLTLVRTHYRHEGDCIVQQLSLENDLAGEPVLTEWQDFGNWYISHGDGPGCLRVECKEPEDCADFDAVMNLLLAKIDYAQWGAECFAVWP